MVKRKAHSSSDEESNIEKQSTIESILNETRRHVLAKSKPKKKEKKRKISETSTRIKIESAPIGHIKSEYIDSSASTSSNHEKIVNFTSSINEDDIVMDSIENKIHQQNIQISPPKAPRQPQEWLNEMYPDLKMVIIDTKLKINDSDDVFMFRVPGSVQPEQLLNLDIDLEGCKVKLGSEKFVIKPTSKIPDPALVLSRKLKVVHFKGNLVLEKYVKVREHPNILTEEKSPVPLPNNLKNRHPLFGSNYKKKIKLDKIVENKLDDALQNLIKRRSKKSSKKHKAKIANSTMLPNGIASNFSPNVSSIFKSNWTFNVP